MFLLPFEVSAFGILLLLVLFAIIAFAYLVIKPSQTRWAIHSARRIAAEGKIGKQWRFENVFRILAGAHNDLEAAHLWHKLLEIKEKAQQ
jgi:hypothetical protein